MLKFGFVHEKSNRFRFSAETKLKVETQLLTFQKSKQLDLKSPEWKSQIGKDLTNLQLGSKRNFGTRKSENFWNFESGEFFRKNLNNLNKNWMLQISEYSTNPESGKNVSSSYNFFIFHFRFVDLTAPTKLHLHASSCIFVHLGASWCILVHLHASWCIFMHLEPYTATCANLTNF